MSVPGTYDGCSAQPGAALATTSMLATDLDGTFIGDERAMKLLWAELEASGVIVCFSTGRHLTSVRRFYAETGTDRRARVLVGMVGTEVWWYDNGRHRLDAEWAESMRSGWDGAAVVAALADVHDLVRQPEEWQSDLKVSYFLDRAPEAGVADIDRMLRDSGQSARVVYSAGRYLDILPEASGKGAAVAWVAHRLGVEPENVVVAGDTGNDLDMMRPELGFRAVAVGNASAELKSHHAPHLYHAAAHHAAGIREGLVHHGWFDS